MRILVMPPSCSRYQSVAYGVSAGFCRWGLTASVRRWLFGSQIVMTVVACAPPPQSMYC